MENIYKNITYKYEKGEKLTVKTDSLSSLIKTLPNMLIAESEHFRHFRPSGFRYVTEIMKFLIL